MLKIPKQEYTTEFRTLAVKRVKDGQNIRDVARELGISHQTLRNWVKGCPLSGNAKARPCDSLSPTARALRDR